MTINFGHIFAKKQGRKDFVSPTNDVALHSKVVADHVERLSLIRVIRCTSGSRSRLPCRSVVYFGVSLYIKALCGAS